MRKCSIIFALLVICTITAFGQVVQFKHAIIFSCEGATVTDSVVIGVNSGNPAAVPPELESTYLPDVGPEFGLTGQWKELAAPASPPPLYYFRLYGLDIRPGTWPPGVKLRPYDFRGYNASNQVDSFLINVTAGPSLPDGMFPESGLTLSWPAGLSAYATTWQLLRKTVSAGSPIGTFVEMLPNMAAAGTSITDLVAAAKANRTYLIIKTGAFLPQPPPPVLVSPYNAEEGVVRIPTMVWSSSVSGALYHLQIYQYGEDNDILVVDEFNIPTTSFEVSTLLQENTYHYWKVEITDGAGHSISPYSTISGFTTGAEVPVEMTSFTTSVEGLNAKLCWKTATEVNNYGFEIERRAIPEGIWNKIGFVAGAGTSNKPCEYTYTDKNLEAGKYVYRIKQVDNDGTFKYSSSTEIQVLGMPSVLKLERNYPNPFNPTTTIQFTVPQNGFARLQIYNVIGQEVANLFNGPAEVGKLNTVKFEASSLPSGLYFSVLEFGSQRLTSKMVFMK